MRVYSKLLILGGLVALSCLLASHSPLFAGIDARERDRAAIVQILNAQQAAWNRGDVDAFVESY